jgi:hypothetical protein
MTGVAPPRPFLGSVLSPQISLYGSGKSGIAWETINPLGKTPRNPYTHPLSKSVLTTAQPSGPTPGGPPVALLNPCGDKRAQKLPENESHRLWGVSKLASHRLRCISTLEASAKCGGLPLIRNEIAAHPKEVP